MDPHRFEDMLARGVNVCVATDSLASSPSLSVLEELRFVHRQRPHLSAALLIEMGTVRAARALGLEMTTGSMAAGLRADLTAIPLEPGAGQDPLENLLQSSAGPVGTWIDGRQVA